MRLEQQQLRGLNGLERACDPCAGCERPGALDGEERDGMVGVERIPIRVGDQHVRRELADAVGDRCKRNAVDLERVVAEVKALEVGTGAAAARSASPWRISFTRSTV